MPLKKKKIIIGLTGGIAAYKIPNLIRLLIKSDNDVQTIMTRAATKFITELTIETVSRRPVAKEMFPEDQFIATHHIDLAEWSDLMVIAPATANFIGKIASGVCDDLLTTVVCATKSPVLIVPAMNSNMYLNPITQKNIELLKSVGYLFMDPAVGEMACETTGVGRLPEPDEIFDHIKKFFEKKKLLNKKRIVITAGPCREPIDPVRYISNRSSGKMGYALASAAFSAGGQVILISGPTSLAPPDGVDMVRVETTDEMQKAVEKNFKKADCLIMAAAPADFKTRKIEPQKIKKSDKSSVRLELFPTIDILMSLKKSKKKNQKIVGFALETEDGLVNARRKLKEKGLDLIILNSLEDTVPFDSDFNKVSIIDKKGEVESLASMTKSELAHLIIKRLSGLK